MDHARRMPARPPIAVAISFVDAINRCDLAALGALMTEDHVLVVFDEPALSGRAANVDAWQGYMAAYPSYVIHPHVLAVTRCTCGDRRDDDRIAPRPSGRDGDATVADLARRHRGLPGRGLDARRRHARAPAGVRTAPACSLSTGASEAQRGHERRHQPHLFRTDGSECGIPPVELSGKAEVRPHELVRIDGRD